MTALLEEGFAQSFIDLPNEDKLVELCQSVGRELGMTWAELVELQRIAFLHDVELDILRATESLVDLLPSVAAIGVRWDGLGDPEGLVRKELPLASRVVSVCKAYLELDPSVALFAVTQAAGTQFCPRVVRAFKAVVNRRPNTRIVAA